MGKERVSKKSRGQRHQPLGRQILEGDAPKQRHRQAKAAVAEEAEEVRAPPGQRGMPLVGAWAPNLVLLFSV